MQRVKGENHWSWKGGRKIDSHGYVLIYSPYHPFRNCDYYVFEHRLIMEQHLKRYLTRDEIVHHINGNSQDNSIENLQLMTRGEHFSHHNKKDLSNRFCCKCNSNKTGFDSDGYQRWLKNPLNKNEYLCSNCYMKNYRKSIPFM